MWFNYYQIFPSVRHDAYSGNNAYNCYVNSSGIASQDCVGGLYMYHDFSHCSCVFNY